MRAVHKKILFNVIYVVAVVALALCVWAITAAAVGSEFVVPGIKETFIALGTVLGGGLFWSALGATLLRSALGFLISLALFGVLFALSASFASFARLVDPVISAMRSLPAVAVTLILILALGGYGAPVALGVIVIMPIMYSAARARVATVDRSLLSVCRLFGASKAVEFKALWLPSLAGALPEILSTAFSYNVKAVIGAEILAQTAGSLGMLMKLAQQNLQTAMLLAFVVAAVVVSVVAEFVIRVVLRRVLKKFLLL